MNVTFLLDEDSYEGSVSGFEVLDKPLFKFMCSEKKVLDHLC